MKDTVWDHCLLTQFSHYLVLVSCNQAYPLFAILLKSNSVPDTQ